MADVIFHCPACGAELTERDGGLWCPVCAEPVPAARLRDTWEGPA